MSTFSFKICSINYYYTYTILKKNIRGGLTGFEPWTADSEATQLPTAPQILSKVCKKIHKNIDNTVVIIMAE